MVRSYLPASDRFVTVDLFFSGELPMRLFSRHAKAWTETLRAASVAVDALPVFLQRAQDALVLARREYQARAFGPFWDAVEAAMKDLGHFNRNVRSLRELAQEYTRFRQGRGGGDRTFPDSLYRKEAIPDPRPVLTEYQAVLRQGRTDTAFAMVLEHRRTQATDVPGFRTVGDAVANLESAVIDGFLALVA